MTTHAEDTLFDLSGQVALVTGASSGLGRQFALTLARRGAKVALCARNVDRLGKLADEIAAFDGRAVPVPLDVTDAKSVRDGVARAATELGAITVLVNNSGVAVTKPALELTEDDWDYVLDTNLRGAWLTAQEVGRHMAAHGQGGSIINIASVVGFRTARNLTAYAVSKAGLIKLTHQLALEWARYRIRVNAIAPGYIRTEMNRDYLDSPKGEELKKRVPQRRFGEPSDLDGVLVLLASPASSFMTGSVIAADGGHAVADTH
ncbi:MAG TPA: glucose 1-dehydrogenase [Alphaproteobacteria bacterium]|nr:glucose 1-dehydrogenase [Alphaproteobacteria bacterium]